MKKPVCLLLTVLLLALWTGSCLADITAAYRNGRVTVAADEEGFWEITIDSEWTGYVLNKGHSSVSIPMKLEDGQHTVKLYNPDNGRHLTAAFEVEAGQGSPATAVPAGPGGQPTAAPRPTKTPQPSKTPVPKGPVKVNSVSYKKGVITVQVSGLRGYAEVWIDGGNTGLTVTENGETRLTRVLSEGKHTLALYSPAYNETDKKTFSAVRFQPDAEALRPVLNSLVKDEAGETLDGGAAIDQDETSYVLRVSVDSVPHAVLTLGQDQLRALLNQGLNAVECVNGSAVLRVDLTKLTDQWFDTELPVAAYTFALEILDTGARVTAAALTESGNVEASALTGVTLTRNGKRVSVKHNGIY